MARRRNTIRLIKLAVCLALIAGVTQLSWPEEPASVAAQGSLRFAGPTASNPIAINADDSRLIVANPDNDSITLFRLNAGGNEISLLGQVEVGQEPNSVAVLPNGSRGYVANTVSGTVSVINMQTANVITNLAVGTEPYALCITPNGTRLYCANASSNNVTVIDTSNNRVLTTIENVGFAPRALAITNDGDADDSDETLYVGQFFALPRAVGKLDGEDDSKVGLVTVVSVGTNSVIATSILQPLADSGFRAAGDAINRIAPPATPQPADFRFTTGAYPNQIVSLAVKNNFVYVPNTGASPNGPVRFNVNTQSLLNVINRNNNQDAGRTINMHQTVARQAAGLEKLFITQPWGIAFENRSNVGFVASAASNIIVKIAVDPATGAPTVLNNPVNGRVLDINVGKNPRGIVINSIDTRAYVMNYVSRDVYVIDLTRAVEQVIATIRSAPLPTPGSQADIIHIGKELYHTSVGEFDPAPNTNTPIIGRMSSEGWGGCSTCHPFGWSDNVVWLFGAGPRRTVSQHTDFDQTDPQRRRQRALNWSAIFDEEEDFENNIRNVSGGLGIIIQADGITPENPVNAFDPANGGRRQLKVRGINAWDAIRTYIQFGIRAPISPVRKTDPDVIEGERIFRANNCQQCHGGPQWTSSTKRFGSPPPATEVVRAQLIRELRPVGTFDPNVRNEIRQNAAAPLGADGFAPASLLSVFAFPRTFFHNGGVDSLEAVLQNVQHRSAGTGGVDLLDDAEQRRKLVRFILSIDARTPPINP